ncbi:branched-chain amino acid ABC transporter permease [Tepidanaerobacter sp. GT38]|uniref:branched-chain amino acid ABC transporter permease n=1 Tax=Tepidanaerobacter sp. GT38 TaxID=2722793 RepID=UPI001F3EE560|nr:branched-chain amino acid ABC transporter permease [Tepidanaerobacter sp. GT38]MCG1011031.1 branched-chain amino acid ABC transporter permease [Tepidanaerobacter sp. GT38]
MQFYISILTFTLISVIAVTGIYVLTGLTGMFSLGQAAFMAIGAYVSGFLVVKAGVPFVLAAIIAVVISVIVGYIVGLPTVRLRRDYISLVTLGFGEAITALLNQTQSITGGALGFSGIPKITTLPLALISAIVCIVLVSYLKNSKYGRQCIAARSDELAAKAMGINVPRIKMTAFLIAVAVTSYAGVLYAFFTTYVDPGIFGWKKSAEWVIMVFFGGVSSLTGSIFGTIILTALPEVLRFAADYRTVFYAVLVLLIINFKPTGLFGEYELSVGNLLRRLSGKKEERSNA